MRREVGYIDWGDVGTRARSDPPRRSRWTCVCVLYCFCVSRPNNACTLIDVRGTAKSTLRVAARHGEVLPFRAFSPRGAPSVSGSQLHSAAEWDREARCDKVPVDAWFRCRTPVRARCTHETSVALSHMTRLEAAHSARGGVLRVRIWTASRA